jgi:uncharacterized protein (TIGR03083 family)
MNPNYDYMALTRAELKDLSNFLHTLKDPEWDSPSLCEGWKVRHVIGHITLGYSLPLPKVLLLLAFKYGFSLPKASHFASMQFGEEHAPKELLEIFDKFTSRPKFIGIAATGSQAEHFVDHLIHHWDVSIPLGKTRQTPEDRLRAALDTMVVVEGKTGIAPGKKLAENLKLSATDVAWSYGSGKEVSGDAMSLILALSGRGRGFFGLQGEGLSVLQERVSLLNKKQKQAASLPD